MNNSLVKMTKELDLKKDNEAYNLPLNKLLGNLRITCIPSIPKFGKVFSHCERNQI